jgi:hypothetical protein
MTSQEHASEFTDAWVSRKTVAPDMIQKKAQFTTFKILFPTASVTRLKQKQNHIQWTPDIFPHKLSRHTNNNNSNDDNDNDISKTMTTT